MSATVADGAGHQPRASRSKHQAATTAHAAATICGLSSAPAGGKRTL